MNTVPLSYLRGKMLPPVADPAELAAAQTDFMIIAGYVRASVRNMPAGVQYPEEVVFTVEAMDGPTAGVPQVLFMASLGIRPRIVDLLRRTGLPVGPCVLTVRHVGTLGLWSFCSREPDGSLWDPLECVDEPPPPGSPPGKIF